MPQPFELDIKVNDQTVSTVRGEFDNNEHKKLLLYLEQHDRFRHSKPLREGFPCSMTLRGEYGKNLELEASLPDEDTLSILLHCLRPFILQNEPASYLTVSSIIGKRIDNPLLRKFLHEQREWYNGQKLQQLMKIEVNNVILNSENVLYNWLNSHEYHGDTDKRKAIDELFQCLPDKFGHVILVSMLMDKIKAIRNVAALIAVILGKSENLHFQMHDINSIS